MSSSLQNVEQQIAELKARQYELQTAELKTEQKKLDVLNQQISVLSQERDTVHQKLYQLLSSMHPVLYEVRKHCADSDSEDQLHIFLNREEAVVKYNEEKTKQKTSYSKFPDPISLNEIPKTHYNYDSFVNKFIRKGLPNYVTWGSSYRSFDH